jgi:O-antigen ligase
VQAHNGYIDIVNEIGLIGALILIGVALSHFRGIVKLIRGKNSYVGVFHAAILLSALIMNYSESSLLRTTHIWWIMVCASIFEVYVLTNPPAVDSRAQHKLLASSA